MILSDIKRYLMERQSATLADVALHFDSEPDAVRGMLEQWVKKGKVRKRKLDLSCGSSCDKCDTATTEIYEWITDSGTAEHEQPITFHPGGGCSCGS
jgi:putative ferrous iron transport protein C